MTSLSFSASIESPVALDALRSAIARMEHFDTDAVFELRRELLDALPMSDSDCQKYRASVSVLIDLCLQGWTFVIATDGSVIEGQRPIVSSSSRVEEKQRLRRVHQHQRDNQLNDPAVRTFIAEMERPRVYKGQWVSIFSLMRDGAELAAKLTQMQDLAPDESGVEALRGVIDPYIQPVEGDELCSFTGLRLQDIWRYFRYTWSTPYNSVPGRRLFFLVRDRACPNHPIIGISALGSSVVQVATRDKWIGWSTDQFVSDLRAAPSLSWARWIDKTLREQVAGIYRADFVASGLLKRGEVQRPTKEAIARLRHHSVRMRRRHHLYPHAAKHKDVQGAGAWAELAKTPLFVSKRAETLAALLDIRRRFLGAGYSSPTALKLGVALGTSDGVHALKGLLRRARGTHVGIDMLDITVCGAVDPYRAILGGKLVSLLMVSPEITKYYETRYASMASVIASAIAARPVKRPPTLALLCTTSLYAVGASQYNRLKMPAECAGGRKGDFAEYIGLGESVGWGSFHLSSDSARELDRVLQQGANGRRVNSIFGEGVSPRLRKLRSGIEALGFPPDALLKHGSPRLVFVVPLVRNVRDVLLGCTTRPARIIPRSAAGSRTSAIVNYWIQRWLLNRTKRPETLEEVQRHRLTYPITHGARVVVPPDEAGDQMELFG